MSFYDQNRPIGVAGAPPIGGMSWTDAAHFMRLHGRSFRPPPHMIGMSLAQIEAKAREENREAHEAQEAKASAARIENAPKSIERALLDPPSPKRPVTAQRGWRQRVRFLNHFRRCRTYREAAARIGVDESTVRRWRKKFPAFARRCDEIVEERYRENSHDLRLRAGETRSRPIFFRGKQIGEHVVHDDRALMFLMKLDDAARARAEAREERREERREQRAHELRMKELEISKMHASAAHPASPAKAEEASAANDLPAAPADIAPPEVVEVASPPHPTSPPGGGEEYDTHVPLPRQGESLGEGEEKKDET